MRPTGTPFGEFGLASKAEGMRGFLSLVSRLLDDRRGVTALEYGMIGILIAIAIVGAVTSLGGKALTLWTRVSGMTY